MIMDLRGDSIAGTTIGKKNLDTNRRRASISALNKETVASMQPGQRLEAGSKSDACLIPMEAWLSLLFLSRSNGCRV